MNTQVKGNDFPTLDGMSSYIGTKISGAKPMNRLEYNQFRGWKLPEDEDGSDSGYVVQYADGYISWSPAEQFEEAYRLTTGMNFGLAMEAMKKGYKVARAGWNGKGMFCIYVPGTKNLTFKEGTPYADAIGTIPGQEILPHIDMYTVNSEGRRAMLPGWLASQSDMVADDWCVVSTNETGSAEGENSSVDEACDNSSAAAA